MEIMQKPSIGRVVHFHSDKDAVAEAAIVIAVHSDTCVNVSKCNANGTWNSQSSVQLEGVNEGGSFWRWPPRV